MGRLNGLGATLAATLLASLTIAVQPAAADPQKVFPFASCTTFDAAHNIVNATFNYYSSYDDAVEQDVGPDNFFSPGSPDQGQTTFFFPGANFDAFEVSFVSAATPSITWNLNGLTATAGTGVPECTITADGAPQQEEAPAIGGTPLVGSQLAAYPGVFKGWVYRIRFQWQRQNADTTWSDIGGATAFTYTPSTTDAGRALRVEVKADSPGSFWGHPGASPTIVDSAATSPVATAAAAPSPKISGITIVGQTLTASAGTGTFSYDWQRCTLTSCASTGGTGATYVLTSADVAHFMRVAVTPAGGPQGVSAETTPVLPRLHR